MNAFSPWQQRAYDHAAAALDAGRMGHGLLICGPEGLGKRAVAERLAERVLCAESVSSVSTPAAERSRHLIAVGTHPDLQIISFVANKSGDKLRTEIVIEQMRELSQKLSLTPQYGVAQVAIIDPADAINRSACNALLKTLEEPAEARYLWLISADPARLPATIRSRCQRLEFKLPPHDEALAWLLAQGHPQAAAEEALDAARGHPGLADQWLREDGMALRRQVATDLARLEGGQVGALEIAQRWSGDEHAGMRLRHAADLALTRAAAIGSTDPVRLHRLAAWFDAANRTRDLMQTTVRADLAMMDLLLAWCDMARAPAAKREKQR